MKIVLDTNVFISGIFFNGPPSKILKAWRDSKIQIILSAEILLEYQRVAEELSSKFPLVDIEGIIELLMIHGELFETNDLSVDICEDPDDNKFIECAIAASTKIIVSGDKHLLKISGFKGITVLNPREFLDNYLT
jgi:putative PIN family toxin of toxin-antitoxin system